VKLLYWERNGFVLWQKRLEKDRFPWPRDEEEDVLTVTGRELNWLLDGIDVFRLRPHKELSFSAVR
jgi:transposase